jgi:hypothetical protein
MGGCCGTSPGFIRALAIMLRQDKEDARNNFSLRAKSGSFVPWTGGVPKYQWCQVKIPPRV